MYDVVERIRGFLHRFLRGVGKEIDSVCVSVCEKMRIFLHGLLQAGTSMEEEGTRSEEDTPSSPPLLKSLNRGYK